MTRRSFADNDKDYRRKLRFGSPRESLMSDAMDEVSRRGGQNNDGVGLGSQARPKDGFSSSMMGNVNLEIDIIEHSFSRHNPSQSGIASSLGNLLSLRSDEDATLNEARTIASANPRDHPASNATNWSNANFVSSSTQPSVERSVFHDVNVGSRSSRPPFRPEDTPRSGNDQFSVGQRNNNPLENWDALHNHTNNSLGSREVRGESIPHLNHFNNLPVELQQDTKKYSLFVVPDKVTEIKCLCFNTIGSGINIYVRRNCHQSHRGGAHPVVPREAYVMRSRDKIFAKPSIDLDILEPTIVREWLDSEKSLEEWNDLISSASRKISRETDNKKPVAKEEIEEEMMDTLASLNHKTPGKRKYDDHANTTSQDPIFSISALKPLDVIQDASTGEVQVEEGGKGLLSSLDLFDKKFGALFKLTKQNEEMLRDILDDSRTTFLATDIKISKLADMIGAKPAGITNFIDASSLWEIIGDIADKIQDNQSFTNPIDSTVLNMTINKIRQELTAVSYTNTKETKQLQMEMTGRLNSLDTMMGKCVNLLRKDINNLYQGSSGNQHSQDISKIQKNLLDLNSQIKSIVSSSTKSAIKFCKLGFTSFEEASTWYQTHATGEQFGLLVDFHMVMEHVAYQLALSNSISKMQKLHKIKFIDIGQTIYQ